MKVLGIISEYNPFHNGHLYHLRESKECIGADFVIAIMSGNFVQRGEPALVNKWERAKVAVQNGIDLVIELPVAFSCNNAENFAKGAIEILNGIGCVTHISFGSEDGKIENIETIAEILALENNAFKEVLKTNLGLGFSFAKAREKAINSVAGRDFSEVIKGSNNILAIEYLKQLKITESKIIPVTLKRIGPEYNEKLPYGHLASATLLRNILKTKGDIGFYVPKATLNSIENQVSILYLEDFYQLIMFKLLQLDKCEMKEIYSVSEGLENRIKKQIRKSKNIEEFIEGILSKRYTETRIKRLFIHCLLQLDRNKFNNITNNKINYCRVLGFNNSGAKLLRIIKKKELNSLPILTNINKEIDTHDKLWELLNFDLLASDIYNLIAKEKLYEKSDYVIKPYYEI